MFNDYMLDHEFEIDDEVIESVKEYITLGQKSCASSDHTKKKNQKKNRDGKECF